MSTLSIREIERTMGKSLVEYQDMPPGAAYVVPLPDGMAVWYDAEGEMLFNESALYKATNLEWHEMLAKEIGQ